MRALELYYEKPHSDWFLNTYFHLAAEMLIEKNKDIDFKVINVGERKERDPNTINSAHIMTVRNPENEKYILISFWDKNSILFNTCVWNPLNMVQLLTSSGLNRGELNFIKRFLGNKHMCIMDNIDEILTPFTYNVYSTNTANLIEELYSQRDVTKLEDKFIFRGAMYNEREYLLNNLNNPSFIFTKERIGYREYLAEQINNLCALSINGAAEICNRDIELFGLGMPVLRTNLNVKFHNDLIPDVHYISLGNCEFRESYSFLNPESLKNNVVKKFEFLTNNRDYCLSVGENARKWYLENCTMNSMILLLEKLLKINKLFE